VARLTKREQYRAYVEQWRRAGPELERFHEEELRRYRYDPSDADTLLEIGDLYRGPPRLTSGLVEMQRLSMKAARQQGLLPARVRETPPAYKTGKPRSPAAAPKPASESGARKLRRRRKGGQS
jgi:hypothetical protein